MTEDEVRKRLETALPGSEERRMLRSRLLEMTARFEVAIFQAWRGTWIVREWDLDPRELGETDKAYWQRQSRDIVQAFKLGDEDLVILREES
jgi:hypothetical protein